MWFRPAADHPVLRLARPRGSRRLRDQQLLSLAGQRSHHEPLSDNGHPRRSFHRFCAHIGNTARSEEHTSELQSLMRISYAVFCLKKKKTTDTITAPTNTY